MTRRDWFARESGHARFPGEFGGFVQNLRGKPAGFAGRSLFLSEKMSVFGHFLSTLISSPKKGSKSQETKSEDFQRN
jgi:hypothetical protein